MTTSAPSPGAPETIDMTESVTADEAAEELPTSFLWMDPPDHTRLRRLVAKAFTPRLVAGLRPRIGQLVDQLIDNALDAGEFDLIETIAYPLPLTIVCELVGVPASDHAMVQQWSQWLARGFDPEVLLPEQARAERSTASRDFQAYFRALIDERRRRPQDDLLSALAAVEDQGDVLTEVELLTSCVTTLVAGHETTVNLVGSGILALLRSPDQIQVLRDRPELVPAAVEELLRYDPPVQLTTRSAKGPLTVGDHTFADGEGVVVLINAANRDPAAFPDPDRLDVTRFHQRTPTPPHQLAFSLGIHYKPNVILRGPERLPVSVRQRAPRDTHPVNRRRPARRAGDRSGEVQQGRQRERDRERVGDLDGVLPAEHRGTPVGRPVGGHAEHLDAGFGVEIHDPVLRNSGERVLGDLASPVLPLAA